VVLFSVVLSWQLCFALRCFTSTTPYSFVFFVFETNHARVRKYVRGQAALCTPQRSVDELLQNSRSTTSTCVTRLTNRLSVVGKVSQSLLRSEYSLLVQRNVQILRPSDVRFSTVR
jgi:hypothetical protein